ncbi:MAG TPA: AMP-binding protein [Opitutaceae bacterium]|jgi:acyl-[acyl-carrier-protein]-phospholipid O-acyltransferase/long-chain-fatty-acid--[acyl-carrier-protein] ligase
MGSFADSLVFPLGRFLLRTLFRAEVRGLPNFPALGRRLVIANHASWLDGALLAAFLPGKPVFAVDTRIARQRWVSPFLRLVTAYPIDPTQPMLLKALCQCVEEGRVVVVFPEGRLSTTGGLMKVYDGAGFIAQKTGAAIIPVHIGGAGRSVFTRLGGKFRRRLFPKVTLTVGQPSRIAEGMPRDLWTQHVYQLLSQGAFAARQAGRPLFRELILAARSHGGRTRAWENHEGRGVAYADILGRAAYLGSRLLEHAPAGSAAGIMMPTSIEGALVFWGMQYAHIVPAWLNFTMGLSSFASTLGTAAVGTVVTSRAFVEAASLGGHVAAVAERGGRVVYLEDLVPSAAGKLRAAWLRLGAGRAYGRNERRWIASGRDERAAIFFTSGSSGLPKAVVLSHGNLLSNVAQLMARVDLTHGDCVFNALPLFHAFGFTGGMLMPLMSGVRTVLYPTPLHYGLIPEFIYGAGATVFFATNSFLSGYARKAHNFDFVALRYVFAGAEKLQASTQKVWAERFGIRILEGYGTTEASPALTMNTPLCYKAGTVGQFMPGIEFRLDPVPGTAGGRLHFRGPNRMMGYYLHGSPGVLSDTGDWYDTGDIVSVDEEGFVTILGRAKRFAKIAGEMVSLAAVEEAVASVASGAVAVVNRPHPAKGEELVLFSGDPALTLEAARAAVRARGLSDLCAPRQLRLCSPFPLLGSGKPDLVALQELAARAGGEPERP